MKKLTEELEKELAKSPDVNDVFISGLKTGIITAIQIVKSHNQWIPISELPPPDEDPEFSGQNESIEVLLCNSGYGLYEVGYYDFQENEWKTSVGYDCNFTHWTFLPELP